MSERDRIAGTLETYQRETKHQIVVLTMPSLGEEKIESFSLRPAKAWALGNKGFDDGIPVTLALKEHGLRIEFGKGMQQYISDADASDIMAREMMPQFSTGHFAEGLERGLNKLMEAGRRFGVKIDSSREQPKQVFHL